MTCQPMEFRDVQIAEAEWKVVEAAVNRRMVFREYGYETEVPSRLDDATLLLDIAVETLLSLRDQANDNHPR